MKYVLITFGSILKLDIFFITLMLKLYRPNDDMIFEVFYCRIHIIDQQPEFPTSADHLPVLLQRLEIDGFCNTYHVFLYCRSIRNGYSFYD